MDKKFAQLDHIRLAYKEQGQGPAVVLLHGFCGSSAYWDKLLPLLPDGCRFIAPDLRGHGDSEAPEGTYTMETIADDIAQFIGKLGLGQAIVLGHSLGGYATLALAERHPNVLSGFGLIHSTAYPDSEEGKQGRLQGMETIKGQGLPAFIDGLIPKLFAPDHLQSMPEAVEEAKRIGNGTSPEGAIRTLEGMRVRPDRNGVLQGTKLPLLLVAGENDRIIPVERTMAVSGERVTQQVIRGSGHMSMVEAPQELAEAIAAFAAAVR
ncbi:alpha/beta hydrolase [Paenibacillus doosanensis]|uniref:Tropinesterase n=1 Tax=Paenibacillus konkukensis TaxID=2020716 RepID=A0ABY4RWV0_9BACL|nr:MULTISPECIES: alpha/beta hydrolase [Paenibacillus]MCS7464357.1 alpha/beta hydrolase [Paenibacillus doosanensis]UQZ85874.1 Tropinesterase [Paenibacillus konkukensis]